MESGQQQLIGESRAMNELRRRIRRVAGRSISVVLLGETGTGKELVARALHRQSGRKGPFVAINCAAVPESVAESTFFGHERGAFTGADRRYLGVIEQADGGTLFLDEIAEMPMSLQAKLLRTLQEREVVRLGARDAARPTKVDLRVVVGSHRDLAGRIEEKLFREDLYYRLSEYLISLPALRDRGDDPLLLAGHFLDAADPKLKLSREVKRLIRSYPWPGNVRELQSAIRAAAIDATGSRVLAADLRLHLRPGLIVEPPATPSAGDRHRVVIDALDGRPKRIGEIVEDTGIPKSTLRRLLSALLERGAVVAIGEGRGRTYALTTDAPAPEVATRQLLHEHGVVHRRDFVALTGVAPRTANRQLEELVRRGVLRRNGRRGRAAGYVAAG